MSFGRRFLVFSSVILLTLCSTSCSYIDEHYGETCKSHAYVRTILADHISSRFHSNAPVRIAVIPFSVPANLSGADLHRPGVGNELAYRIREGLLEYELLPIIEVLNRQDWPGKTEEFFTGNFGALAQAREADYDIVLVGKLDPQRSTSWMSASTKVIEVESGITLWYGETRVKTWRPSFRIAEETFLWKKNVPNQLYLQPQIDGLGYCIAKAVTSEEAELH